jgi:hypothetical protein
MGNKIFICVGVASLRDLGIKLEACFIAWLLDLCFIQ